MGQKVDSWKEASLLRCRTRSRVDCLNGACRTCTNAFVEAVTEKKELPRGRDCPQVGESERRSCFSGLLLGRLGKGPSSVHAGKRGTGHILAHLKALASV